MTEQMTTGLDLTDLLALYDRHERFEASFPDLRREELAHLVRQVGLFGNAGAVIYSDLGAATADAAIEAQMAHFQSIGQAFEWKVYAHDQPPDLVARLAAHGFEIDEHEAILVLDVHSVPAVLLAPTPNVKRVQQLDELRDVAAIRQRVRGDQVVERLARELRDVPEYLSVYVAYVENAPAACGWIRFPKTSPFASLWGGATLPELRKRGLYTALLAARVHEASARGWRFVTVDARSMSRPILEKRGFRLLTYATACTWHG